MMGYYTYYQIEIENVTDADLTKDEHIEQIEKTSGYQGLFEETVKWYEHEEQMKEYSKKHPSILFILSGEGEESGDIWKQYFKGGKSQICKAKITFDEFDPNKLK